MAQPPDRLLSPDGTGGWYAHRPPGRRVPAPSDAERRERLGRVVWLMPDTGVFPLWSGGGAMTPSDARELLGLTEGLVTDLQAWGWEEDSPALRGGHHAWVARGVELRRRLQAELGPDWDVELKPE